jgi:hypothetical protein
VIVSAHVAAGAVAGMVGTAATDRRLPRIGLAFVLGLVSHALLDAIPHSDYEPLSPPAVLWVALGEIVLMAAVLWVALRGRMRPGWRGPLAAGVLGAGIADAKFVVPVFGSVALTAWVSRYGNWLHGFFHSSPPATPLLGLAFEVGVTAVLVGTLLLFPRSPKPGSDSDSHEIGV